MISWTCPWGECTSSLVVAKGAIWSSFLIDKNDKGLKWTTGWQLHPRNDAWKTILIYKGMIRFSGSMLNLPAVNKTLLFSLIFGLEFSKHRLHSFEVFWRWMDVWKLRRLRAGTWDFPTFQSLSCVFTGIFPKPGARGGDPIEGVAVRGAIWWLPRWFIRNH